MSNQQKQERPLHYVVGGKVCENIGQAIAAMKEPGSWKAAKRESAPKTQTVQHVQGATRSNGFSVVGYSPAQIAKARQQHADEIAAAQRLKLVNPIVEIPGPFDLSAWMRKTRPGKARSKPYEIEQAAEQCAELCTRVGWLEVRVQQHLARREGDEATGI